MNSFEANIRNSSTKGEVNKLRNTGFIPCILYGGKEANQKISINKKNFKNLVKSENFLSNVLNLNIEGKEEVFRDKERFFSAARPRVQLQAAVPGIVGSCFRIRTGRAGASSSRPLAMAAGWRPAGSGRTVCVRCDYST